MAIIQQNGHAFAHTDHHARKRHTGNALDESIGDLVRIHAGHNAGVNDEGNEKSRNFIHIEIKLQNANKDTGYNKTETKKDKLMGSGHSARFTHNGFDVHLFLVDLVIVIHEALFRMLLDHTGIKVEWNHRNNDEGYKHDKTDLDP